MEAERRIEVGETADGRPVTLPIEQVLTGRAFLTGKSGSGKSNSASVVIEGLLESGHPALIVDTDGEYYGLKEEYELLHAGADEGCDIRVGPEHAERIAGVALEENVPVILDVSGYLDGSEASELIRETARHLFAKEKKLKRPFLLVVEEVHEYIPEGGGMDETGRMLIKVGKRGRKHGLGIVGISQRPADVKKDFITQANWLVWHRLTWENDTDVVGRVVGKEYAEAVSGLDDGEAFLQRDWTDDEVTRVQFHRKRTFDAGATPGLDDVERPELKSVSDSLVGDLEAISERSERREDRIEELEAKLEEKEAEIAELEEELRVARDVSRAARRMAEALSGAGEDEPFGYEQRLSQKNERIRELEAELDARDWDAGGEGRNDDAGDDADLADFAGAVEVETEGTAEDSTEGSPARGIDDEAVDAHVERFRRRGERLLGREVGPPSPPDDLFDLLSSGPVVARIDGAKRSSDCNHDHTWAIIAALVSHGPLALHEFDPLVEASREATASLLTALRKRSLVVRDEERRYALNAEEMRRLAEGGDARAARSELASQWDV